MGGTFTIKCESNNTGYTRDGSLIVSIPDGKQITVSLQQKKNEVSSGGYKTPSTNSFFYTLYGITIGKTTFNDMVSRGFKREGSGVTIKKWMGNYSVRCYKQSHDATETITNVWILHDKTYSLPEEWIRAGAPSGNMNIYRWKQFLQNNGFVTTEEEKIYTSDANYANIKLYAVNKSIGIEITVETDGYHRFKEPDPRLSSSNKGINTVDIKYTRLFL